MGKQKVPVVVLKWKVVDSSGLEPIGKICRKARNKAVIDWLLRQHGLPESEAQAKGKQKRDPDKPLSEATKLYHAVRESTPELSADIAATLSRGLNSHLGAKLDWRERTADKSYRRQAILAHEIRPPFATSLEIPVPNKNVEVTFGDRLTVTVRRVVTGEAPLTLELSTRKVKAGHKRIIREVASGERKLADSKLVERDGTWYWHVPVLCPHESLNAERVAELRAVVPKASREGTHRDRPYCLTVPKRHPWYVGDGRYLQAQTVRLIGLKKQVGWRYRQRNGAGHGRKKIDAAVRRRNQQLRNIVDEVRRRAIADIVRRCEAAGCGTLRYLEPSLPARKKCWFEKNGLTWDWTRFCADLENALGRRGIKLELEMWKWGDAA